MIIHKITYQKDNLTFWSVGGNTYLIEIDSIIRLTLLSNPKNEITVFIKYFGSDLLGEGTHKITFTFLSAAVLYKLLNKFVEYQNLTYESNLIFPTKGSKRTFVFIKGYIKDNDMAPTMREIAKGIGITSSGVVVRYVVQLLEEGFLVRPYAGRHKRNIAVNPVFKINPKGH